MSHKPPLEAAERLPCGAWLYALDGAPSSVNARHVATPTDVATLAREIAARVGRPIRLTPALSMLDPRDLVFRCHEVTP